MKSARRTRRWAMGAAGAALFAMLGAAIVPAHGFAPTPVPADATPRAAARQPNILFILIDDMGFADLSLTGNTLVATPNIDALARDGMVMTPFYDAAPICPPSRAGFMTGRLPAPAPFVPFLPPRHRN